MASSIVSLLPVYLPPFLPAAIVAATRLISVVPAVLAGISTHEPLAMVPRTSLRVSSSASATSIVSSSSVLLMVSSSVNDYGK